MVTNMPLRMSADRKAFMRANTSPALVLSRASMRNAVRNMLMTSEPETPFPETSATTMPTMSSFTFRKS